MRLARRLATAAAAVFGVSVAPLLVVIAVAPPDANPIGLGLLFLAGTGVAAALLLAAGITALVTVLRG